MLQDISGDSMCFRHTYPLVCLHAPLIGQIGILSAPIEPSLQQKSAAFSSASSRSPKTQSALERAIWVLSP
jgi:hypothetical protein